MKFATIIQRRDIILSVRPQWLNQYKDYPDEKTVGWNPKRTFGSVRVALQALDPETCSPNDVGAALGMVGSGWANNICDECGDDFPVVLRLGEEPDYEARYWSLCANCLKNALDLLTSTAVLP